MARKSPCRVGAKYWREDRQAWFVKLVKDGKREERRLKIDNETELTPKALKDAAEGARQKLIDEIKNAGRPSLDCSVDRLINEFLAFAEKNNAQNTFRFYLHFLSSFGTHVGKTLRVADLKLSHVNAWLAKHYPQKGNQNTRHDAIACVKRLFNWATKEMEYFDRNPVAALKKPARTHRDACPTTDQWDKVTANYAKNPDDPFNDFLAVIRATGCRPQEMRVMEARHLDFKARMIQLEDGEIPGKKYGRGIIMPEAAVEPLQRLALKYAEGPLFRNENGRPWTKDALNCRFQRLQRKLKFRVNSYSARHTKATDMLEDGGSAGAVASLLGHRDPTVVLKFYGKHIEQRAEHLRGLMNGGQSPAEESNGEPPRMIVLGGRKAKGSKKDAG